MLIETIEIAGDICMWFVDMIPDISAIMGDFELFEGPLMDFMELSSFIIPWNDFFFCAGALLIVANGKMIASLIYYLKNLIPVVG